MPGFIGLSELLVLLPIVLLLFGARRIPQIGRAAGAAIHGFRKELTGRDDGQLDRTLQQDDQRAGTSTSSRPDRTS